MSVRFKSWTAYLLACKHPVPVPEQWADIRDPKSDLFCSTPQTCLKCGQTSKPLISRVGA